MDKFIFHQKKLIVFTVKIRVPMAGNSRKKTNPVFY